MTRMTTFVLGALMVTTACTDQNDDTAGADDDGGSGDGGADTTTVEGYLASVGDTDLNSPDGREFAATSSAGSVLAMNLLPLVTASFGDGTCPAVSVDGPTTTLVGDCTDSNGNSWTGTATTVETTGGGTATFDDFGFGGPSDECPKASVSYKVTGTVIETSTTTESYEVLTLVQFAGPGDDCTPIAMDVGFDYHATVTDTGEAQVFAGSGRVGAEGYGALDSTTADELIAGCSSEPDSGTLTVESGSDTLIVTFDGATSCEDPGEAPATLNGADIGQLGVASCATAGGRVSVLLVFLSGLLAIGGRRRPS